MMQDLSEFISGEEYDAQYRDSYQEEVAALSTLATSRGGPVLDLCCGTGIVTIPLAQNTGLDVHGVDISEPMLRQARVKAENQNISFHLANAIYFSLPQRFELALMTGNAFQAFLSEQEILRLLTNVRRHLLEGGLFVFDTRLPEGHDLKPESDFEVWGEYQSPSGQPVRYLGKNKYFDGERGVLYLEMKRQYEGGRETFSSINLKFTPLERLSQLLEVAGFRVLGKYANWRYEPIGENSKGAVLILSRQ